MRRYTSAGAELGWTEPELRVATQRAEEIRELLKQLFDQAIIRHGFTDYNRDYEVVLDPDRHTDVKVFRFRGCMEVAYRCLVVPKNFSMNDDLTDKERWEAAGSPGGYTWWQMFTDAYPGAEYVDGSTKAAEWTERLGVPMHEVTIEANLYQLTLVFHDLVTVPKDDTEPSRSEARLWSPGLARWIALPHRGRVRGWVAVTLPRRRLR